MGGSQSVLLIGPLVDADGDDEVAAKDNDRTRGLARGGDDGSKGLLVGRGRLFEIGPRRQR